MYLYSDEIGSVCVWGVGGVSVNTLVCFKTEDRSKQIKASALFHVLRKPGGERESHSTQEQD